MVTQISQIHYLVLSASDFDKEHFTIEVLNEFCDKSIQPNGSLAFRIRITQFLMKCQMI